MRAVLELVDAGLDLRLASRLRRKILTMESIEQGNTLTVRFEDTECIHRHDEANL